MDLLNENITGKQYLVRRKRLKNGIVITVARGSPVPKRKRIVIASGLRGKRTVGNIMISQLQPFKRSMAQQLSHRGFYVNHLQLKRIIPLYYNQFVSNEVNPQSNFVPINIEEFVNHVAYRISPSDNLNGDVMDFRNLKQFNNLDDVVFNIIDVFKKAKLKKRAVLSQGANSYDMLTDDEQEQARACSQVERHLEAKAEGSQAVTKGSLKNIIIIGVVLFLLYYLLK